LVLEVVTPDTPGVAEMITRYHEVYGGQTDLVSGGELWGAYDEKGLAAVMGWVDAWSFRFVTEWAKGDGRRGLRGSALLMRLARKRQLVGLCSMSNQDARAWLKANGGREEAVFIVLPEAKHGRST
jgi:hypothetical protein